MERKIYRPDAPTPRRTEWVDLPDGRSICVWGVTAAEWTAMKERAARPAGDPRGKEDNRALSLLQILASCYDDEPPDGKRIYGDLDMDKAGLLSFAEFNLLTVAISRVNGLVASEQEVLRDFLAATTGQNSS